MRGRMAVSLAEAWNSGLSSTNLHSRQATAEKFNLQWPQGAIKKMSPKLKKYIFSDNAVTST
jgi:hypothetical protein